MVTYNYNYSRYNIKEVYSTDPNEWSWTYSTWGNKNYQMAAINMSFNSSTNKFVFSNFNGIDDINPNPAGTIRYVTYNNGVTAEKWILRADRTTWDVYVIDASGVTRTKTQGTLIVDVIAEDGTYPTNGAHTDGYWYVRGSMMNNNPTVPDVFTSPSGVLEIGDVKSITWGASTDPEGGAIQYELGVSVNSGPFSVLITSTARAFNYTIPVATTLQFRVRAKDESGLYSAYTLSNSFVVSKPKYYWSKYNVSKFWGEPPELREYITSDSYAGKYKTATWDNVNKKYILSNPWPSGVAVYPGDVAYDLWNSTLGIVKYVSTTTLLSQNKISINSTKFLNDDSVSYDVKSTLAQSNIQAIEDTYPLDGKHTDGYWYIRGSRVNQSIASTGSFTTPVSGNVLLPNKNITITFEHSPAPSISLYEVDYRYGTGVWTALDYNNTTNRNLTISKNKTDTELELRVRAKNTSNIYSAYVYSTVFKIKHNIAPTKPDLIVSSLTPKRSGEKIALSASNLVNIDGDILTYNFEFYNGKVWQEIALNVSEYKEITHIIPKIFGGISNAKYRVRAFDGELYSDYAESNAFIINAGLSDIIAIDKTVVNKLYDTAGNGGRKLVRLDNGWLVAGVVSNETNNLVYFYVDKQDGNGFSQLCFLVPNKRAIAENLSLVSNGNYVYAITQVSNGEFDSIYSVEISVLTQSNIDISSSMKLVSSSADRNIHYTSLAINENGTELHAAWSGSTNTLLISSNIRYVKGTINSNGSVTWGTIEQVTNWDNSGQSTRQPSIICKNSDAYIITSVTRDTTQAIAIYSKTLSSKVFVNTNEAWGNAIVYSDSVVTQQNPSVVYVPKTVNGLNNGRIWVTWHGRDTAESTNFNIRVSYSDDNGKTWSTTKKLTIGTTYHQTNPSITANVHNEIFIVWSGSDNTDANNDIRTIKNVNDIWGNISTISSGTTTHKVDPSTLLNTTLSFSEPVFIYKDTLTKVGFYGSYVNNQKPSTPILLGAPFGTVNYGDIFELSTTGSTDFENDSLTYSYEFYNGTQWTEIANKKLVDETVKHSIPYIFGSITTAKYRVRAFDGISYSDYAESGNFAINNLPSDILRENVLIADRTNGANTAERKLVKLSNGWLVFGDVIYRDGFNVFDIYISKNNGLTFEFLIGINDNNFVANTLYHYSLVSKETSVYITASPVPTISYGSVYTYYFDVANIKNPGKTINMVVSQDTINQTETQYGNTIKIARIQKNTAENKLGKVSTIINESGNEIHATWVSRNNNYNYWNVRYAKGVIDSNNNLTWGAVEQISRSNTAGYEFDAPSIVVVNNIPIIAVHNTGWMWSTSQGSSSDTKGIAIFKRDNSLITGTLGAGWTAKSVYWVHNHVQISPSLIYVPRKINGLPSGRLYITWQGKDSINTTNNHIRLAYSDDLGVTWSPMQKLTSDSNFTEDSSIRSIAVNNDNKVFITYDKNGIKQLSSNDGNVWQSKTIINNSNYVSPSVLLTNDFVEPMFAVKDYVNSKIYFYGSWIDNRNPSIPSLTTTALTVKNKKDKVILSASGSYNIDGNDIFYFFEFFNGKEWIEIASYKYDNEKITHIIPHIFGGTTEARYRVRAYSGKTYSGYAVSNKFTINVSNSDIVVNDATVVNQAYNTNGNNSSKLVRLDNGWLIASVFDSVNSQLKFYKTETGDWSDSTLLCYQQAGSLLMWSLASKGTSVYFSYSYQTLTTLLFNNFDAVTIQAGSKLINQVSVDSFQAMMGENSLAINEDKTEVHAVWSSRNSSQTVPFNIRYAKGKIQTDNSVIWDMPEQVTSTGVAGVYNLINPTIQIINNVPIIAYEGNNTLILNGGSTLNVFGIQVVKRDSSLPTLGKSSAILHDSWSLATVHNNGAGNYPQGSPSMIKTKDRIWIVWHGIDSSNSLNQIRISYSDDNGKTWSTMQKLTNTVDRANSNPSITFNKKNEVFIVWQGNKDTSAQTDNRIKQIKFSNGEWGKINEIKASPQSENPSTLVDKNLDFTEPLFMYKDVTNSKIRFSGSWIKNTRPSNPILVGAPTTPKNQKEKVVLYGSSSIDLENDDLVYSFEFYNGREWTLIAENILENEEVVHIIPQIIGGTTEAKYRVRAFDGILYTNYVTSNNFTIKPNPLDILLDTTVVDKSYNITGNNTRKLVRLSNGWIVAAAISTEAHTPVYFYVNRMDGNGFVKLCSYENNGNSEFLSLVYHDTKIYFLVNNNNNIEFASFDVVTQLNINLTVQKSYTTQSLSSLSLAINKSGTELHAAWSCKSTSLTECFNVQYTKAEIKLDTVTWSEAEQVTMYKATSITFAKEVSIITTDENIATIVFASPDTNITGTIGSEGSFGGSAVPRSLYIVKRSLELISNKISLSPLWTINKIVDNLNSYSYSSPSVTYVPKEINGLVNGRIWTAWHGKTAEEPNYDNIFISYSDDYGKTWSTAEKL